MDLREGFVSHSPFKGADYCGEKLGRGRVISGRLANRFGSRFGRNTKLLRGVIGPISSPSDYLDTACDDDDDDDDDDDAGAAETVPSQFLREKLQLVTEKYTERLAMTLLKPDS